MKFRKLRFIWYVLTKYNISGFNLFTIKQEYEYSKEYGELYRTTTIKIAEIELYKLCGDIPYEYNPSLLTFEFEINCKWSIFSLLWFGFINVELSHCYEKKEV